MAHKNHRSAGFSLVELVLALAVAMILTGFAVPTVQNAIRVYTVNSAAASVTRMLQLTRYVAIRQNSTACVLLDSGLFGVDANCDGAFSSTDTRVALPSGVTLDAEGPGTFAGMNFSVDPEVPDDFAVAFDGRGSTTISPTVSILYLEGWGHYAAVTVSGVGRAHAWRYEGDQWH
jgi:type IV fimbrial biogenesis protein FimT